MEFLNLMTFQVFHDHEGAVAPKPTWARDGEPSFVFKNLSFYNINNQ